jgi:hypothetical protein
MTPSPATTPEEKISKALQGFLGAADAANEAACILSNEILSHRKGLISEATIVRETATLLLHVGQNLARTIRASAKPSEPQGKAAA